jgi:hypothetical protein
MSFGPCLCGDPACGNCFLSGQVRVACLNCTWVGRAHELEYVSEIGPESNYVCPECGAKVEEDDL